MYHFGGQSMHLETRSYFEIRSYFVRIPRYLSCDKTSQIIIFNFRIA